MSSLRQIKKRIRSIESTRKIARAMELVSVTKLRKVEDRAVSMRPYVDHMDKILKTVVAAAQDFEHPLMEERAEGKRVVLCVFTSDSGLCGVYNSNILRKSEEFIRRQIGKIVTIVPVGKKGFSYFKTRGYEMPRIFLGLNGRYNEAVADEITGYLQSLFLEDKADEVYVAATRFESTARHHPAIEKFLNIKPQGSDIERLRGHGLDKALEPDPALEKNISADVFIWEPSQARIFDEAITEFLVLKMRSYVLQSFACEHAARIIAMSMAKENSMELLEKLILLQNKIRQSSITKEVLEIISAAEALKG